MTGVELASAADAAAGILHADEAIRAAELARAVAVLEYCDRHRVDETILVEGAERIITGGADGTPGIGEFVVGEIAAILGMSLGWAFGHIASLLNLRHRHPGLWEHTRAGDVRVWEATRVADAAAAADLGLEACLAFDRMCTTALCLQPWARVRGQVEKWIITADPVLAAEREPKAAASRRVELSPIKDGHTDLWGRLNAADGIAFDQALDVIADELPTSVERDHRRAAGLGMMARQVLGQDVLPAQLTHRHGGEPQAVMVGVGACPSGVSAAMAGERLSGARPDHGSGPGFGVGESPAGVLAPGWMFGRPRPPRQAELVLHLDRQSLLDPDTGVVDLERWGPILAGQVKELLDGVRVTVRPIIDPDLIPASDSYVVPPTMRFVLEQRHPVDAFPFGTQKSSRCDADHTIPFDHTAPPGHGQTRLGNLAPLSRYVHRLRTHGGWQVEQPAPGTLLWRSPGGFEYVTNPSGSAMVRRPPPPEHRWWQVEPPDPPDPPETVVLPPCHDGDGDASMPPVQPRADGLGQPPKTPPQDSLSWPHAS